MKRVGFLATLIFIIPTILFGYTSPGKPQGFVNDFAHILSPETVTSVNQSLTDFSNQTTIQVVVVTIPELKDEVIETYAVKLFEDWKMGDKEKDNGVLLLIAPNEKKVRIEVGYGLEGVLTDAQSYGIIQDVILPEFKTSNYDAGVSSGVNAIMSVVKSEADYSQSTQGQSNRDWGNLIFVGFVVLASILGSTKSWWFGGVVGGIFGIIIGFIYGFVFAGILSIIGLTLFGLLLDFILSKGGGRGGPWIGGMGGGSGGGGFGGFGGGSSGGGGASGSW